MSHTPIRVLAQSIPNHVWTATPDGRVDWFNDQVLTYSGLESADLVGSGWLHLVHPEEAEHAREAWLFAVTSGTVYDIEFRIRRHDGAYRWHVVRALPLRDATGQLTSWVGSNTDIDDRRQASHQTSRDRDRIWALSPVLKVVRGRNGIIQAVNPSWTRVLGWTAEDSIGRHVLDFVHPDGHASICDPFSNDTWPERIRLSMRHATDGWRDVEWTAAFEDDTVFSFGRDITAERRASEALAVAEEALRQSQKMEAVGQLTGGIAHDFNNLLQGILGSLDVVRLRLDQGKSEGLQRYVDSASSSALRAAALTHRLLAFSRRQPLHPQVVDASTLVGSMEDLLHRTLGERIALSTMRADDLWRTRCDPNQLENAVLNLAINARDAMPEGGELHIELQNVVVDALAAAQGKELAPGEYVGVTVSDNGEGMDETTLSRAFEPFFTTKPIGQGTGLGLSMIYGFARQSEGYVQLSSQPGVGTRCTLLLPRAMDEQNSIADPLTQESAVTETNGDGETILVVEDEEVVREIVVDCLRELGYRIHEAADGAAGLDLATKLPRLDLLVTDVGLPGLNGRQLAEGAREHHTDLQVLFITGYTGTTSTTDFLLPGMAIMKKPFSLPALASKVRSIMANRSALS